jgi:hypothetical protein
MSEDMRADGAAREESFPSEGPVDVAVSVRLGSVEVRALDAPGVRLELRPGSQQSWELGLGGPRGRIDRERWAELARRALAETEIAWSEQARRLVVSRPRARGVRTVPLTLVLEVPQGSRMVGSRTGAASLHVSGALGSLDAATGSGSVTVGHVDGDVNVKTGSGDLRLDSVGGRLRARTGSGDVEAASLEGRAAVTSGSGDIRLGIVCADAAARTGRGGIAVAEARSGRLSLATGSGDVRVGIPPGVAAELDIVSGSGGARSELPLRDGPSPGSAAVRVRARTGSGAALVTTAA